VNNQQPTLIIDAHNLAHRAAHAYDLWQGEVFTGLFHGVFKMLMTYIKDIKPAKIAIVSDPMNPDEKRSWRHNFLPTYKNRAPKRDEKAQRRYTAIQRQLIELKHAMLMLPLYWFEQGYNEADDVIGSVCKYLWPDEQKVIVSTDKDMFQLVDNNTKVFYPGYKNRMWVSAADFSNQMARFVEHNKKVPLEEWWHPENTRQWLEYRILRGDTSDCIPGLRGVGVKKAWEIMKDGGFAAHCEKVEGGSRKIDKYLTSAEAANTYSTNLYLMSLPSPMATHILFDSGHHQYSTGNLQGFIAWCERYGLKEIQKITTMV